MPRRHAAPQKQKQAAPSAGGLGNNIGGGEKAAWANGLSPPDLYEWFCNCYQVGVGVGVGRAERVTRKERRNLDTSQTPTHILHRAPTCR